MGLKSSLFFVITLLIDHSAFAQNCNVKQNQYFSYNDLVQLIKNPDCKIKSIKDVISKLPTMMSDNVVLMNRSQSLQGPHRTDYVYPRAILHSMKRGKYAPAIALTFNGHSSQANYLSIEVMSVDVSKSYKEMFAYHDIKFPDESISKQMTWEQVQAQIKFSEKNPQTCQQCHGNPARPIFEQYPNWEGSLGRRHMSRFTQEEAEGFKNFINSHKNNPESRYHSLDLSRFVGDITLPHSSKPRELIFSQGEQNFKLNALLFAHDSHRVVKMIQASETYKNLKYTYWAAAKECKNISNFFPNNLLNQLKQNVLKRVDTKSSIEDLKKTFPYDKPEEFGGGNGAEILHSDLDLFRIWHDTAKKQGFDRKMPSAVFFRLLIEGQGFSMHKFWMDLNQPSYRMNSGAGEAWYYAFQKLEPEVSKLTCEDLEKKSYEHLTRNPIEVKPYQVAEPAPVKQDYPLVFTHTCAKCHDSKTIVGPAIPFTHKENFQAWLAAGVNKAKILFKVHPKRTLGKMPPNRELTPEERQDIYNFLKFNPDN